MTVRLFDAHVHLHHEPSRSRWDEVWAAMTRHELRGRAKARYAHSANLVAAYDYAADTLGMSAEELMDIAAANDARFTG